jgi:adenosylhomocysteine nucleosidase
VFSPAGPSPIVVLISANAEWRAVRQLFPQADYQRSPFGEFFDASALLHLAPQEAPAPRCLFFHGGWGKIAAAASTQYVIDRWQPRLLVNLGTCGGFEGQIERGAIVLAEKTVVYDIIEQMGDFDEHIAHYTTQIDLSWLQAPFPIEVQRGVLVSADRDLLVEEIPMLKSRYGAAAGDWESGAIAWVAARSGLRLLILRGVTDLVGASGGEAYGNLQLFEKASQMIMKQLVEALPQLIRQYQGI